MTVDSSDNVYVLNRGEHPVIVFDKHGNFVRSFGEGSSIGGRTVSTPVPTISSTPSTTTSTAFASGRPTASWS